MSKENSMSEVVKQGHDFAKQTDLKAFLLESFYSIIYI